MRELRILGQGTKVKKIKRKKFVGRQRGGILGGGRKKWGRNEGEGFRGGQRNYSRNFNRFKLLLANWKSFAHIHIINIKSSLNYCSNFAKYLILEF